MSYQTLNRLWVLASLVMDEVILAYCWICTSLPAPVCPNPQTRKGNSFKFERFAFLLRSPRQPATNLLLLLHGVGDTAAPFATMARTLQLPHTAALALQGPLLIPETGAPAVRTSRKHFKRIFLPRGMGVEERLTSGRYKGGSPVSSVLIPGMKMSPRAFPPVKSLHQVWIRNRARESACVLILVLGILLDDWAWALMGMQMEAVLGSVCLTTTGSSSRYFMAHIFQQTPIATCICMFACYQILGGLRWQSQFSVSRLCASLNQTDVGI